MKTTKRQMSTNTVAKASNEMQAENYLKRPYARILIPEEDGSFRAEIAEFPGCIALGETAPDAIANLEDAAFDWLMAALGNGQGIPPPFEANNDYSGKLVVRLPKSLHKKAAWAAERDGVSLNQLILTSIAIAVGERQAATAMVVSYN